MDSMTGNKLDALALEYQGDYGTAFRNVDISYLMNNPSANGVCRVFGLGLKEQANNLPIVEVEATGEAEPEPVEHRVTARPRTMGAA